MIAALMAGWTGARPYMKTRLGIDAPCLSRLRSSSNLQSRMENVSPFAAGVITESRQKVGTQLHRRERSSARCYAGRFTNVTRLRPQLPEE
jgi:hypothetical protein